MAIGLEAVIILLLIVLNGLFAMSELALVSARRARLAVLEKKGVAGAAAARALSDEPQRFLPTVQVGITLVSVLTGVFGGARIAAHLQSWLETIPRIAAYADSIALAARRGRDDVSDPGAWANWCRSNSRCASRK